MGLMDFFSRISDEHAKLKKKIHTTRIPLSPTGQKFATLFYFTIPVVLGYPIMQYFISFSPANNVEVSDRLGPSYESRAQTQAFNQVLAKAEKRAKKIAEQSGKE